MKVKMISLMLIVLFCLSLSPVCLAQEQGYFAQMGQAFTRGFKNIVSFPWEIPYTIGRYDQKNDDNPRAFRDIAGFFDGTFRAVTRLSSGMWDVVFSSVVPGQQGELHLDPKTFF